MSRSLIAGALGRDFGKLHPAVRERHGFSSADGVHSVADGVMERIWQGSPLFAPFLYVGARRNIMFPESGRDVPFRIESWAYRDAFGRETLSLNRSFGLSTRRRFDEYVVAVPDAKQLIIYVGSHQHLAVRIDVAVSPQGGVEFRTGRQRLLLPGLSFRFPLLLSASALVHEWYDESSQKFRIDGRVRNRLLGDVFGNLGSFQSALEPVPTTGVPAGIRPVREESRW